MLSPDLANGGPVPRTPWDFPHGGRRQMGRWRDHRAPARKAAAFFTVRRSGCVPAEPYPPYRNTTLAFYGAVGYSFTNRCAVKAPHTRKTRDRFCVLKRPFDCPTNGEPLNPP